jgi:cellulose synthase/poly-beta-1,6-N-acetylglucosamine synthase-like glycosyltransferase
MSENGDRLRSLGEILLTSGLITPEQLELGVEEHNRTGVRLGEALLHGGHVGSREIADAVAAQLALPAIDVSEFDPDDRALQLVPEPLARRHRFVPLAIRDHRLVIAAPSPLPPEAVDALAGHTNLPLQTIITPEPALDRLLHRIYHARYTHVATADLLNRTPDESAYRVLTQAQKLFFGGLALLFGIGLLADPIVAVAAFNIASLWFYSSFSVYKLQLAYEAISDDLELPVTDEEVRAIDERELPVYTILIPLYREAAVVGELVASLARMDYPAAKLDVKVLVEEDDDETRAALRAAKLPPHFKIIVVPDSAPKTKPKACNYGLLHALGDFVVIYDAEDRPEPDQLKKVAVAFGKADARIVCIQCKLNYHNRDQNMLTRWFTSEYSNWFDLLMPGLDAADAPIPLGGTSNHFRRDRLEELGAWDPFNVTEDADLGIRLHKAGYKTAIIDSTTYEEANSDLYNWVRQRSRWVKGYMQTWLVHMRHPVRFWRAVGWRSFFSFQFMIGGTFFSFLVNPFYWTLTTIWGMTEVGIIRSFFPGWVYFLAAIQLLIGNFVFTYINVAGAMRRRYYDLVKSALLSPVYWALMSIGAWKGAVQLVYRPFYWEKTVHGLDVEPD